MASLYKGPIRGLTPRHGFFKSVHKGEDTWLQKPGIKLPAASRAGGGEDLLHLFGVFDGHGGKAAAAYTARTLQDALLANLQRTLPPCGDGGCNKSSVTPPKELQEELQAFEGLLEQADWSAWAEQERLVSELPAAFLEAFSTVQDGFFETTKESGTTATAVALVGWEAIVANVGDSCAYLDTGSEVLQISGNHRLDDNRVEKDRITRQGFEVSASTVDGAPCGPLRVWPGGLAMGRTIGDFDAGEVVLCTPEVRQVTLPASGGRIVVASDGLWDAVTAKSALHHVRGMPANKAAHELVATALKARGLRDDITVVVIDAVPSARHKLPPQLAKDGSGQLQLHTMQLPPTTVHHPLQEPDATAWLDRLWQRRLQAVRTTFTEAESPRGDLTEAHSGASSLVSSATVLSASPTTEAPESPGSEDGGSDADSEASAGLLASNPFALANEEDALSEAEAGDGSWQEVPAKHHSQPSTGRKHALPPSEGSPSEPLQLSKAWREAAPSPAASPMQSSLPPTPEGAAKAGWAGRHARGRQGRGGDGGRGRGRSGRGGRSGRHARPANAPHHVDGFEIQRTIPDPQTQQPPQSQLQSASQPQPQPQLPSSSGEMRFASGLTFLSEGGFSFGPPPAPAAPPADASAGTRAAVIDFTPATHGRRPGGEECGPRPQASWSRGRPQHWRGPRRWPGPQDAAHAEHLQGPLGTGGGDGRSDGARGRGRGGPRPRRGRGARDRAQQPVELPVQ